MGGARGSRSVSWARNKLGTRSCGCLPLCATATSWCTLYRNSAATHYTHQEVHACSDAEARPGQAQLPMQARHGATDPARVKQLQAGQRQQDCPGVLVQNQMLVDIQVEVGGGADGGRQAGKLVPAEVQVL